MKTEIETIKLYGGEVEIEYLPNSHIYRKDGKVLDSVTGVTSIIDKSGVLLNWSERLTNEYIKKYIEGLGEKVFIDESTLTALIEQAAHQYSVVKKEAAGIGDLVHNFAKKFAEWKLGGKKPEVEDWPPEAMNGISAFLDWQKDNKVEFLKTEQVVYSGKYNYVGRYDLLAKINGNLSLVDYKTGRGVYVEMLAQLSAYCLAYEEENGKLDNALIIHFNKDTGTERVIEVKGYKKHKQGFVNALKLKRWKKEYEKTIS